MMLTNMVKELTSIPDTFVFKGHHWFPLHTKQCNVVDTFKDSLASNYTSNYNILVTSNNILLPVTILY